MRFAALALIGAGFVVSLGGFTLTIPTIFAPVAAVGGGGGAPVCAAGITYNLGKGATDIGRFQRVLASRC